MSDIRRRFGVALRASRTRQRLTQEELAERSGLSHKFIGEVERGVGNPTIESVARLAGALSVEIAELFMAANVGSTIERHYRLSKRDVQMVREAADSLDSVVHRLVPGSRPPHRRRT